MTETNLRSPIRAHATRKCKVSSSTSVRCGINRSPISATKSVRSTETTTSSGALFLSDMSRESEPKKHKHRAVPRDRRGGLEDAPRTPPSA